MKNFPILIQVRWDGALETILIESEASLKKDNQIATSELWFSNQSQVSYAPHIIVHKRNGTKYQLQLQYRPEEHPDLYEIIDTWGVSTITFDVENSRSKPKAVWSNEPANANYDGPASSVKLIRPRSDEFLGYAAVLRKVRRQDFFKRQLLSIERECALSGESEQSVLDAAHIKEVKHNGSFSPDNGFLLRTDVHRLFDKGLLVIDPESGRASLTDDVPKNSSYWQQVDEWRLKPPTLGRVRASLLLRYKDGG